jgi:hypothetical protein
MSAAASLRTQDVKPYHLWRDHISQRQPVSCLHPLLCPDQDQFIDTGTPTPPAGSAAWAGRAMDQLHCRHPAAACGKGASCSRFDRVTLRRTDHHNSWTCRGMQQWR